MNVKASSSPEDNYHSEKSLNTEVNHDANFFATGGTKDFRYEDLRYLQW